MSLYWNATKEIHICMYRKYYMSVKCEKVCAHHGANACIR